MPPGRPRKTAAQYVRDYADIIAYHDGGKLTQKAVGEHFGVSGEWVGRILRRAGVIGRCYGRLDAAAMEKRRAAWSIYEQALQEGATKREARQRAGLAPHQVFEFAVKFGVRTPPSRHVEIRAQQIAATVVAHPKLSGPQIARLHGLTNSRVYQALKLVGLPTSRRARLAMEVRP